MTDKAAAQLFVSLKEQHPADSLLPLGFAHAYEPHKKGWDKKKETQFKWAYAEHGFWQWEEREDGIWILEREVMEWNGKTHVRIKKPDTRVEQHLQPRIIENTPMSGFKIAKSVSRSRTSNKVWRVVDPRGFELEIYTSNMETILEEGGVLKNEIQGTLQWFGKQLKYVSPKQEYPGWDPRGHAADCRCPHCPGWVPAR